ncbi:MAG TPA: hypothetical protein PKH37_08405 [Alphaproteobacteria bacterium]|nr:hypothetical protein [Alphaproteobacteria bacterium]
MNKGALSRIIRDLTNTGDLSVARAVSKHEVLLDDVIQKARGGKLHDFKAWEDLGVSHGLKTAYTDYIKAATESKNMTPAQADNAFFDMLGRDFSPRSQNRKLMTELIRDDGAKAAHTPPPSPKDTPHPPRQQPKAEDAPKTEPESGKAPKNQAAHNVPDTPSLDLATMQNNLREVGKTLNRLRIKGKLSETDSRKVEEALDRLNNEISTSKAYTSVEAARNGKTLSPISALQELEAGRPVSERTLSRLDAYFAKNHLTHPSQNPVFGAARATMNFVTGPLKAPFHGLNVWGDAHSPFSLRLGTASVFALGLGYGAIEIDYAAHPTLGMSTANIMPPTLLLEPFDQLGKGDGFKDLSYQADWAVIAANWSPEFKEKLMKAAEAYSLNGNDGDKVRENPEFKDVTNFQIEAGAYFLEIKSKAPEAEKVVSTAQAQSILAGKQKTEATSAVSAPYAPFLAGREFVTPQTTAPTTQTAEPTTSQTSEKGVNGAQFKHTLDQICEEGSLNQDVADKLVAVWKQSTNMKVGEGDELSTKNILRSSEVSTFSRNAEDVLVKSGKVPEVAKMMVEDLVRTGP